MNLGPFKGGCLQLVTGDHMSCLFYVLKAVMICLIHADYEFRVHLYISDHKHFSPAVQSIVSVRKFFVCILLNILVHKDQRCWVLAGKNYEELCFCELLI